MTRVNELRHHSEAENIQTGGEFAISEVLLGEVRRVAVGTRTQGDGGKTVVRMRTESGQDEIGQLGLRGVIQEYVGTVHMSHIFLGYFEELRRSS